MAPNHREDQNDPFRPIQCPLISASNAVAHRLTLLISLHQSTERFRRVAEWAAPAQEAWEEAGFQRGRFIEQLSEVLSNRLSVMRQMVDVAGERKEAGTTVDARIYADTVGKDHGRIEIRRCWTTGDPAYLAHVDPDRDGCDLASLVRVGCERRGGDRVTTGTRCFISSLPPKAKPLLQAAGTGASKTSTIGSWTWPSPAHRPQPAVAGPVAQGGHCQQAVGGRLEQGLPVSPDRPQAQTNLDAIALVDGVVLDADTNAPPVPGASP